MSHHTVVQPPANKVQLQRLLNRGSASYNNFNICRSPASISSRRSYPHPHQLPRSALRALFSLVVLLVTWTSLLSLLGTATAEHANVIDRRSALPQAAVPVEGFNLEWKGPSLLVLDTRPAPNSPLLMHLNRRQNNEESSKISSSPSSTGSLKTDPSATRTPFVVPQPFDTSLSNNFTANCATFFRRLLDDQNLKKCTPFSLMLQTSSSFFEASKSFLRITQTLETTCKANVTYCTGAMNGLARELVTDSNCAVDYSNDNPQVLQAYNGLIAYEPLYQASCLRDDEGNYCYANAITNTSATTDSYPYYLPLGAEMSGGARPTCNSCLQDAMAIFSAFAGNTSQPISKTYNAAAQQIQVGCGPQFVNRTATPLKGAAPAMTVSFTPTFTLLLTLFIYLFQ